MQHEKSVKLQKIGGWNTRSVTIPAKLLHEIGVDPEQELQATRYTKDGKIIVEVDEAREDE